MMKKLINSLGLFLFFLAFFLVGLFFMDSIMQLASYPYDVLIGIGMFIGFIYLARNEKDSNVFCVGGSWLTPKELIELKKWKEIELLAFEASGLNSS